MGDGDDISDEFMAVTSEQKQNPLKPEGETQIESEEPIPDPTAANTGSRVPGQDTQLNSRRYRLRANRNVPDRFGH